MFQMYFKLQQHLLPHPRNAAMVSTTVAALFLSVGLLTMTVSSASAECVSAISNVLPRRDVNSDIMDAHE